MINELLRSGAERLKENFAQLFTALENQTILISGGSGFIGSMLIGVLLCNVQNIKIYCTSRDKKRALKKFESLGIPSDSLMMIEHLRECREKVDYVVCAASPTQSRYFMDYPVQTIDEIYHHSKCLLEFAKDKKCKKFVFLSTMEIYGETKEKCVSEGDLGTLRLSSPRDSYPAIKRLCEHLTIAYAAQYSLDICILRLTQVIGAGVSKEDNRVYMMFLKEALEKGEITLQTKGETKRNYVDIFDAVSGILFGLTDAKHQSVYNLANPQIFLSILELAENIAQEIRKRKIKKEVKIQFKPLQTDSAFLPPFERSLDTSKLQNLGWKPIFSLEESLEAMIKSIEKELDL